MRKHGWQLPYHPLQVVAIASFLALGFAFYVFFLPFIGRKLLEYVVLGLYTPLVICVFCVYVWCAATDPGDPGIFKSKKYLNIDSGKQTYPRVSRQGGELVSSSNKDYTVTTRDKPLNQGNGTDAVEVKLADKLEKEKSSCSNIPFLVGLLGWCPFTFRCSQHRSHEQSSEQEVSEDGMFYCSLCEVEVLKYSKHCRVCDKCVDGFDHHCRWLNNCIGRKNYQRFFVLMVSALLLLILQWSIGVLVLILCFLERERFSVEIISKLGSSFSLVPFVVVVATCTVLAMIATLPLAQLFFFHVLLIRKGISTYDYIIALREKEQQGVAGLQSPQMSSVSSLTGLSSASSVSAFHRGAWCTPPRLFLEDQFDVVPPEAGMSVSSVAKRVTAEELSKKNNPAPVKISPWTLARLNADEVSKAAAHARKKSRILQPIGRREIPPRRERDSTFSSGSDRMVPWPDNQRRPNKRGRMPTLIPIAMISSDLAPETSSILAPLQLEARSAFQTSRAMPLTGIAASSPDSSLGSPDIYPFRVSSSGAEEAPSWKSVTSAGTAAAHKGTPLSRSTSDGYEASGGEDSDRVPSRIVHRSSNWSNLLLNAGYGNIADKLKASSSAGLQADARPR